MLYRIVTDTEFVAMSLEDRAKRVYGMRVTPAPLATKDAELGFLARSGGWGAETWGSVANDPLLYAHRPGLVEKAKEMANLMRKQEEAERG